MPLRPIVAAAFLAMTAIPASAQFSGLATPADGSWLHFTTRMRQKGSDQPLWGKSYRADSAGLALLEARDREIPEPPPADALARDSRAYPTNPYDISRADISADGKVLATAAWRECVAGGSYCAKIESYFTTITGAGKPADYPGKLTLSANGRWAFGNGSHTSQPDDFQTTAYLVNVESGAITYFRESVNSASCGRTVANDGTAVVASAGLMVIRENKQERIPVGDYVAEAVIDAAARTIVYSTGYLLFAADTSTGEQRQLASAARAPCLSDDGRKVLFLRGDSAAQAWIIGTDGTGERQLTRDPDGITQAILSGDAGTVYAVTRGGRLLGIGVASGTIAEIVPRTPAFNQRSATYVSPNAVVTLDGVALSDTSVDARPPLPDKLAGVGITIQGIRAKLMAVRPDAVTFLAPPDLGPPYGWATVLLEAESVSPFEASTWKAIIDVETPEFLGPPVHQDWSALVTERTPAVLGELLHSYAMALGPTAPAVAYGDPAPAQALAGVVKPYVCASNDGPTGLPIEVFWQGLAPGMAGIYQIDWRVPVDLPQPSLRLTCRQPGQSPGPPFFMQDVPVRN